MVSVTTAWVKVGGESILRKTCAACGRVLRDVPPEHFFFEPATRRGDSPEEILGLAAASLRAAGEEPALLSKRQTQNKGD
jgi:hypothetical protein